MLNVSIRPHSWLVVKGAYGLPVDMRGRYDVCVDWSKFAALEGGVKVLINHTIVNASLLDIILLE